MLNLESSSRTAQIFGSGQRVAEVPARRKIQAEVVSRLTPVPVVCFTGALVTDIVYSRSAEMQWANFSAWLLLTGIVFGGVAAAAAIVDVTRRRSFRRPRARIYAIGSAVVLIFSLFNNFVHSRDSWTSVVPTGISLSALTVLAMLATVIIGWSGARTVTDRDIR